MVFSYVMAPLGAYVADEHIGRLNTISAALLLGIVGHILFVVSASLSVGTQQFHAIGTIWVGFLILGISVGFH